MGLLLVTEWGIPPELVGLAVQPWQGWRLTLFSQVPGVTHLPGLRLPEQHQAAAEGSQTRSERAADRALPQGVSAGLYGQPCARSCGAAGVELSRERGGPGGIRPHHVPFELHLAAVLSGRLLTVPQ